MNPLNAAKRSHKLMCCSTTITPTTSEEEQYIVSTTRKAISICHEASSSTSSSSSSSSTYEKVDRTPVTAADLAIQCLVSKSLSSAFPDDILIAEEDLSTLQLNKTLSHQVNSLLRKEHESNFDPSTTLTTTSSSIASGKRLWCLDPIDGTKGFLKNQHYAIGLALLSKEKHAYPTLASLGLPATNEILICNTINKTLIILNNNIKKERKPLNSNANANANANNNTILWYLSGGCMELELQGMPQWSYLCCGSLVKYAQVAKQQAFFFVQLVNDEHAFVWDHAAGIAAVVASGGSVSDEFGRSLLFGHDCNNPTFICLEKGSRAIVATAKHGDHVDICRLVVDGLRR